MDKTEEGLVGELQVLILDKAEVGLVGEPGGGRGSGWYSLFPSSNFLLGESRLALANRGWSGEVVVVPTLDPGVGLLDWGLNFASPYPLFNKKKVINKSKI